MPPYRTRAFNARPLKNAWTQIRKHPFHSSELNFNWINMTSIGVGLKALTSTYHYSGGPGLSSRYAYQRWKQTNRNIVHFSTVSRVIWQNSCKWNTMECRLVDVCAEYSYVCKSNLKELGHLKTSWKFYPEPFVGHLDLLVYYHCCGLAEAVPWWSLIFVKQ